MAVHSNGERRGYENGDQEHYSIADARAAGIMAGVNTAAYMNRDKIVNELRGQDDQRRINQRLKHESGFAAIMNGHEPSKGARIDAELAREEAAMLERKKSKSSTGGKFGN